MRRRAGRCPLPLLAAALLLAAAPPQEPDAPPQDSDDPAAPRRVVSLVPAATESLFVLGVGDRVVGVSSYDRWPPEVEGLPRLGALLDPDAERILALEPQLVVLDPSQLALSRQLQDLDIRTYAWSTGDLDSLYQHLSELGAILDVREAAAAMVGDIHAGLAQVAARASATPRRSVLLVFGRRPGSFADLWVSGGVGFLHEIVDIAGGDNRFAAVRLQGFKAGLEILLADPPEVIVELTRESDEAAVAPGITEEWRSLPGFGDVTVGVIGDPGVLVPGPRVVELARRMAAIIRR